MAVNGFPRARRSGEAGRWRRARGSRGCHEPTDRRTSTPPAAAQRPELTPATQLEAWRRPPPVSPLRQGSRLVVGGSAGLHKDGHCAPHLGGALAETPGGGSVWRPGRDVQDGARRGHESDMAAPSGRPRPPSLEAQAVSGGSCMTRAPGGSPAPAHPAAGHCGVCTFTPEDRGHVLSPVNMTGRGVCPPAELGVLEAARGQPHMVLSRGHFLRSPEGHATPSTQPGQRGRRRGEEGQPGRRRRGEAWDQAPGENTGAQMALPPGGGGALSSGTQGPFCS